MPEQAFADRIKALARKQGVSVERVARDAWDPNVRGTSSATFKKVMGGQRALTPVLIEAVARVLDVPPETFPEYRLALARVQLDEGEVGLDQALANLERVKDDLLPDARPSVAQRARKAAQRLDDTRPTSRRTRRAADGEDADQ